MRIQTVFLCLTLASCSPAQWNEKLSTPQDRELALQAISALRSGNTVILQPIMEPQVFAQTVAARDQTKVDLPQVGDPQLVTVSSNTTNFGSASQTVEALNYELGKGSKWAAVQVMLRKTANGTKIIGWHENPAKIQPTSAGNFTFFDKGLIQYLWLLSMIASTATILTAVVLEICSRGLKRRWAWIVGSLVGVCQCSLNWSTASWGIQPLSFSLFGSGAIRASPFDAWVATFSLPIVAMVFLVRRKKLLANDKAAASIEQ